MPFDYKAMTARLRQSFASAAEAQDLLPRLNFEEAMADRSGDATFPLRIAQRLEQDVPNLSPAVLTVAMVAALPTSMMRDSGRIDAMTPAVRDLYIESRNSRGFFPPGASAELCQVAVATTLVNIELLNEARAKQYVPYAAVMQLSQVAAAILHTLPTAGFGAPQLEQNFRIAVTQLQQDAKDFFADKKPAAPKAP